MAEKLRIRARVAEHEVDETGARRHRKNLVREALDAASSVLPSRDPAKNGPEKITLYALAAVLPWLYVAFVGTGVGLSVLPQLLLPDDLAARLLVSQGAAAALVALPFGILYVATFLFSFASLLATRRSRSRVRQALVCPYCRDEVSQEDTLSCARKGCGALYHRECWDECAQRYGGCAIYGCSSKKARAVSAAGYVLQLTRLLFAALLFPPRVARAIRKVEGEGFRQVYRRALDATFRVVAHERTGPVPAYKVALYLGVIVPFSYGLIFSVVVKLVGWRVLQAKNDPTVFLPLFLSFVLVPVVLPWLLALPPTLVFYFFRAVAIAFKNELAALERADAGGGTVLGRLAAGFGAKKS